MSPYDLGSAVDAARQAEQARQQREKESRLVEEERANERAEALRATARQLQRVGEEFVRRALAAGIEPESIDCAIALRPHGSRRDGQYVKEMRRGWRIMEAYHADLHSRTGWTEVLCVFDDGVVAHTGDYRSDKEVGLFGREKRFDKLLDLTREPLEQEGTDGSQITATLAAYLIAHGA
jgi:hypothetical protein